jgi:hypothetical protein
MLTSAGVGLGVAVGQIQGPTHCTSGKQLGAHVGDGQGVGPGELTVIIPLFCGGENEFSSGSMNSKSFGNGGQVKEVEATLLVTRFQWIMKRSPAPLSGVTPSSENAVSDKVFSVPGPVFNTVPFTVQPLEVNPDLTTGTAAGLGAATAESNTT